VGRTVKLVGKPDAGNLHVRFDERGRETERAQSIATALVLDSTLPRQRTKFDVIEVATPHSGSAIRLQKQGLNISHALRTNIASTPAWSRTVGSSKITPSSNSSPSAQLKRLESRFHAKHPRHRLTFPSRLIFTPKIH
jgi:hypothetical protein